MRRPTDDSRARPPSWYRRRLGRGCTSASATDSRSSSSCWSSCPSSRWRIVGHAHRAQRRGRGNDKRLESAQTAAGALYESSQDNAAAVAADVRAGRLDRRRDPRQRPSTAAEAAEQARSEGRHRAARSARSCRARPDRRRARTTRSRPRGRRSWTGPTTIGTIELSTITAEDYSALVEEAADVDVVVSRGDELLGGTLTLAVDGRDADERGGGGRAATSYQVAASRRRASARPS